VPLYRLYNDGNNGTGNKEELYLDERMSLAVEGIVIASIEVIRPPQTSLRPSGGGAEDGEVRPPQCQLLKPQIVPPPRPVARPLFYLPTHPRVQAVR